MQYWMTMVWTQAQKLQENIAPTCSYIRWLSVPSHLHSQVDGWGKLGGDAEGKPRDRTESKDRAAVEPRVTLMGRSQVGLNRKLKYQLEIMSTVALHVGEDTSDLANKSSQRETTMPQPHKHVWAILVSQVQPNTGFCLSSNSMASCTIYVLMTRFFWAPDLNIQLPTQRFHSVISQTPETQWGQRFEPLIFCLKSLPPPVFLSPGIEQPFTQVLTLET